MNAMRIALVSAALVISTCQARADDAPPAIRQFDIETTQRLGRAIYEQDQLAWKATDVLTAGHSIEELKAAKVHGWIVVTRPDRTLVRFVNDGASGPEVFCDVAFTPAISSSCATPPSPSLAADELAQYNARLTAIANVERPCSRRYNSVALKDPEHDGWLVWALASTTIPGVVVYGGHYRFTISPDGKSVVQRDALSRSCSSPQPPDPSQGVPVALFYTQLVANTPIETIVWLSLQHKIPIYIATAGNVIWKVDGDKIVKDAKPGAP